jgi:hypothetical protein
MGSPTNLSSLIKAEEEYIEAKEAALEKWSENICANINNARNIKDKWMEFRKFTFEIYLGHVFSFQLLDSTNMVC